MKPDFIAFAREVLADFPHNAPDEYDIQDIAVRHGLLIGEEHHAPCANNCWCAEYHGDGPWTCYTRCRALAEPAGEQP